MSVRVRYIIAQQGFGENCSVGGDMFSAEDTAAGQADSQSESLCNVTWSYFICDMNAAIRKNFYKRKIIQVLMYFVLTFSNYLSL